MQFRQSPTWAWLSAERSQRTGGSAKNAQPPVPRARSGGTPLTLIATCALGAIQSLATGRRHTDRRGGYAVRAGTRRTASRVRRAKRAPRATSAFARVCFRCRGTHAAGARAALLGPCEWTSPRGTTPTKVQRPTRRPKPKPKPAKPAAPEPEPEPEPEPRAPAERPAEPEPAEPEPAEPEPEPEPRAPAERPGEPEPRAPAERPATRRLRKNRTGARCTRALVAQSPGLAPTRAPMTSAVGWPIGGNSTPRGWGRSGT